AFPSRASFVAGGAPYWLSQGNVSCPFQMRFKETTPGAPEFDLIAHHAPEPGQPRRITSGEEIGRLAEIREGRLRVPPRNFPANQLNWANLVLRRFVYMGDLNVCGRGVKPASQGWRFYNAPHGTPDNPHPDDCGSVTVTVHEDNWVLLHDLRHNRFKNFAHTTGAMVVWNELTSFKRKGLQTGHGVVRSAPRWGSYLNHAF